jgi:hypothetical protein
MYDSSIQGELDRLTTLYKGRVEGANYRSQSELYKSQASAAGTAGWLSASGSLLSGAGRSLYTYSAIRNNQPDFGY